MRYRATRPRRLWPYALAIMAVSGLGAALGAYWLYRTDDRVYFRVEEFRSRLYSALNPQPDMLPTVAVAQTFPTPTGAALPVSGAVLDERTGEDADASRTPAATAGAGSSAPPATETPDVTATPAASPTPLPAQVTLTGFRHEYQKFNNCGPASLAINLSYWGWSGNQDDTAAFLKPNQDDKNVSPIEIYDYLKRNGYEAYIRVNGDVETLKRFLASGYPVLVEKGFWCEPGEKRCNDWFGHYSVFNGYDDSKKLFILQDTFRGPNLKLTYDDVIQNWRAFNFVYLVIYPDTPEHDARVEALLGPDVDLQRNYQAALTRARQEATTLTGEDAAFAWFNVGTTLHYLQDYAGAAAAFDQARAIGLPYRMLWYQFGPYRAYFFTGRYQDVIDLATFAIQSTPKPGLEEAFYWRGLAYEAIGQADKAVEDYRAALAQNPSDAQAREALARLGLSP